MISLSIAKQAHIATLDPKTLLTWDHKTATLENSR